MAGAPATREAIRALIHAGLVTSGLVPRLQVVAGLAPNPTPPCIDIYPDDPFTVRIAYGRGRSATRWLIRARVSTADQEAGQDLLLALMDPEAQTSVAGLFEAGGLDSIGGVAVSGPSGMGWFGPPLAEPGVTEGALLGCTWSAEVTP